MRRGRVLLEVIVRAAVARAAGLVAMCLLLVSWGCMSGGGPSRRTPAPTSKDRNGARRNSLEVLSESEHRFRQDYYCTSVIMARMVELIVLYDIEHKDLPASYERVYKWAVAQGYREAYSGTFRMPLDSWGNALRYERRAAGVRLASVGPDRVSNSPDDVVFWVLNSGRIVLDSPYDGHHELPGYKRPLSARERAIIRAAFDEYMEELRSKDSDRAR